MLQSLIEEQGFAVIPDVFSPGEIAGVLVGLERGALARSRAGLRHALRHPAIADFAKKPKLLRIAQEILGSEAFPFRATLFDKSSCAYPFSSTRYNCL